MKYWIPVFLCLLLPVAASAQTTTDRMVLTVDWGDGTSYGEIHVSGLPAVMRTRNKKYKRVPLRRGRMKSDTAPGERVNRPEFGSGNAAKTDRLIGRRRHKLIHLRKRVDQTTPFVRRTYSTKRTLPRVVLKGRHKSNELQTIVLTNVRITSHSVSKGKGGGDVAMEEMTLACEGIHLE